MPASISLNISKVYLCFGLISQYEIRRKIMTLFRKQQNYKFFVDGYLFYIFSE